MEKSVKRTVYRILGIFFALLSYGAFSEAFRIFTSNAPDIVANRADLIPMAVIMPLIIAALALLFLYMGFIKKSKHKEDK